MQKLQLPVQFKLTPDDNIDIRSEIYDSNCTNTVNSQFKVTDATTPFSNSIPTPKLLVQMK